MPISFFEQRLSNVANVIFCYCGPPIGYRGALETPAFQRNIELPRFPHPPKKLKDL